MFKFHIPPVIEENLSALDNLVQRNPLYISVKDAADFLHIKPEGLRNSIERGLCPFALCWKLGESKAYKIPTVPFYLWYTQSAALKLTGGDE